MNTETVSITTASVDDRIKQAIDSGIELSDADIATIRDLVTQGDEFNRRSARISSAGSDPLRKGNSFPLGVGFTRMTRTAEKRLDASVRRAGESVALHKRALAHLKRADDMLNGRNTEAHYRKVAQTKARTQRAIVERLLAWKSGDVFLDFVIKRVNKDRAGYPASYSIGGAGIVAGHNDKIDVVREYFAGDREAFRALVDAVRGA